MRRFPLVLTWLAAAACTVTTMTACESKLSQESFAKLKKGMTLVEVQKILGSSGEEESAPSGMTISGAGIAGSSKESKDKIYQWKEGGATITVVIADGKVVDFRQSGL